MWRLISTYYLGVRERIFLRVILPQTSLKPDATQEHRQRRFVITREFLVRFLLFTYTPEHAIIQLQKSVSSQQRKMNSQNKVSFEYFFDRLRRIRFEEAWYHFHVLAYVERILFSWSTRRKKLGKRLMALRHAKKILAICDQRREKFPRNECLIKTSKKMKK